MLNFQLENYAYDQVNHPVKAGDAAGLVMLMLTMLMLMTIMMQFLMVIMMLMLMMLMIIMMQLLMGQWMTCDKLSSGARMPYCEPYSIL